ncbi:MAG TPA: carboxypeptidase regulatory-like domain-containing protein [Gemmatimonadales bacterium]|nr:carboxypeptidase regulatory-like domain-containing protein [Gemmatimonadales bacterium]
MPPPVPSTYIEFVLLTAVVLLQVTAPAPAAAIAGSVRDGAGGRPLSGVQVTEAGRPAAVSDSAGRYLVSGLGAGTHQLSFSRAGYAPLELGVLLPDSSSRTQVDVQLEPVPLQLPTLQVVADALGRSPDGAGGGAEIGTLRLGDDWLEQRQAGEADVQRALADAAGAPGRGESDAGLHVRGGGSSENLVLLNGIPLFSAVHLAGASSAVNPDLIAEAELHTGVSPARFGDHLAGVVELETRDPGPRPFEARGSFVPGEVRQTASGYLPGLRTGLVVGARTTYRDVLMGESYHDSSNGYEDLLGVATTEVGGGRLRLVSFASGNRIDFPSVGDGDGGSEPATAGGGYAGIARNAIAWRSHSQGVTWSRVSPSGVRLETAAWWAGSSADVNWLAAGNAQHLRNRLSETGLSARVAWPREDGGLSAGVSLVRPSTQYDVVPLPGAALASASGLALDAAPVVGSVFGERLWRPARVLQLSAGLRASTDFSGWAGVEPRLTAMLDADRRTRLGIGVGRSHQVLQSVINDESALGLLLGFDLPVAAGSGTLPVARADRIEALVERRVAAGLRLSVTGYLRRTSGLALGAASTPGLFPGDSIVVGQGDASGVIGALDLARGPLSGRASLTLARDVRTAGATRYDAGYGQGTSVALDLGYRVLRDTRLQLRFQGGARQSTSIIGPGFEFQALDALHESGELAGTPEILPGTLNAERLPTYSRLDLGLRRDWRLPGIGQGTLLTTSISVTNVLGHQNTLGLVAGRDGGLRVIRGVPRALALEVGWRF